MSLEQITVVADNFISDTHNELLVIKGKWGEGKTFFWQGVIEANRRRKSVGKGSYSYVSLFGINSLENLKHAIIASRVESNANKLRRRLDTLAENLRQFAKGVEKVPKFREYTGGLVGEFLYHLLDNTLICLDDIERKGNDLSVRDIFGIAAVLKEQRDCKVVLILNDETLDEQSLGELKTHGEKIIDREIIFSVTVNEAVTYIFPEDFRHHDLITKCCLTLHVKNMRILQRIRRFVGEISPSLEGSERDVVEAVLRSLVLYVWSYYDKESNAPSLDYILTFSIANSWIRREYKNEQETPEIKGWDETLSSYNYWGTDDLDKCIMDYVKTGYVDSQRLKNELKKKNEECRSQKGEATYSKVWDLYRNSFDDNEEQFVQALLSSFSANIAYLSLGNLQSAVTALREFNRSTLADNLIDEYFTQHAAKKDIDAFRTLERTVFVNDLSDEYLLNRLREIWKTRETDDRSLKDMLHASEFYESWSSEDVKRMNSFTEDDYYNLFKTERSDALYLFVRKCLDLEEGGSEDATQSAVSAKAKAALLKLASECRINRMRVSRLYKIDVS